MFSLLALSATLFGAVYASPIALQPRAGTPPTGMDKFQLKTMPCSGDMQYGGWYPKTFSMADGQVVAVLTSDQATTATWQYEPSSGDVYSSTGQTGPTGEAVWSIGLSDVEPDNSAPDGYKTVTIRQGYQTTGFSFNSDDILVNPAGHGTMAACPVDAMSPADVAAGPQVQLLWRGDRVPMSLGCVDVTLTAIAYQG